MDEIDSVRRKFYLVGVIPVAGQELDFGMPWHDCLQPVSSNYSAVEHAVVECAYAGCDTIWIVCHDDMQPLIKHRLGDYVSDPQELHRSQYAKYPAMHRKDIPIFYVPIHPNDRDRRDCLAWSALYGCKTAYDVSRTVSVWTCPDKYYISFPYGIYNARLAQSKRKEIRKGKNFFFSHQGKTVADGEYLSFTITAKDFKRFIAIIKREGTGEYAPIAKVDVEKGIFPRLKLPLQERWSARFFSLQDVFRFDIIAEEDKHELDWYFPIDNWENYCKYIASPDKKVIKRPNKAFLACGTIKKIKQSI